MAISVVIPVYNSQGSLQPLVQGLESVLEGIAKEYEIILVNDGSSDKSWEAIVDLARTYQHLLGINLMQNYGQHNALLCGIRAARYDLIVTLDDDLQNPPEEIPKLIEKLQEGYDVVYGTPATEQHGLWRDLASVITKQVLKSIMRADVARSVSAFRAFKTNLREAFKDFSGPFVSIDVLLTWGTNRFAAIQVAHQPRTTGSSNYTCRKLLAHALNMMTGFSTVPLQIASWLGFGLTFFGMLVLLYVLGRYVIEGGSVPGFPFLASIVSIFSGTQLFALGIFGEYLARMHHRSIGRPYCVVREQTGHDEGTL